MKKYLTNAEKDEKTLEEKIKKKKLDLDRSENRLKTLTNVKPAFMEEYERQERELEKLYNEYLEKFRNLDYLEHQLDIYNKQEEEKLLESQKVLEKIKRTLQEEEKRILRGEGEVFLLFFLYKFLIVFIFFKQIIMFFGRLMRNY